MCVLNCVCSLCLDENISLETLFNEDTRNDLVMQVKYVLPELKISDHDMAVSICSTCHSTVRSFYTFKKKCLDNYDRLIENTKKIEESRDSEDTKPTELLDKLNDTAQLPKQEPVEKDTGAELVIREEEIKKEVEEQKHVVEVKDKSVDDLITVQLDIIHDNIDTSTVVKEEEKMEVIEDIEDKIELNQEIEIKPEDNSEVMDDKDSLSGTDFSPEGSLYQEDSDEDGSTSDDSEKNKRTRKTPRKVEQTTEQEVEKPEKSINMEDIDKIVDMKHLKCLICKRAFNARFGLKAHMVNVEGYKNFEFPDAVKIIRPVIVPNANMQYECNICNEVIDKKINYRNHMKMHTGFEYQCGVCRRKFSKKQYLKRHLVYTHHKTSKTAEDFVIEHKDDETNKMDETLTPDNLDLSRSALNFKCFICEKVLVKGSIQTHMLTHRPTTSIECPICHRSFSRTSTLNLHNRIKHSNMHHECTICKKYFTTKWILQNHMARYHFGSFPCESCEMKFSSAEDLAKHTRWNHTKMLNFECTVCDKTFSNQLSVNKHIHRRYKAANGELECPTCRKTFIETVSFNRHMLRHVNKLICGYCNKNFEEQSRLQQHVLQEHRKARNFACTLCKKKFYTLNDLKQHIEKSHKKTNDLECPTCHKKFRNNFRLKKHMRLHHVNVKVRVLEGCTICKKKFEQRSQLRRHMETHEQYKKNQERFKALYEELTKQ